jgi:hypothetical protein
MSRELRGKRTCERNPFVAAVACVGVALVLLVSCSEEKRRSSHHIRSCGDVPHDGFGVDMGAETFVCSGKEMKSEPGHGGGPFDELTGMAIRDQDILDDVLLRTGWFDGQDPVPDLCQVDFSSVTVLVAGNRAYNGDCADIWICGVYDDGEKVTATVFDDECGGPEMLVTNPFHFVVIPATSRPVEFKYYIYDHHEEI